MFTAPDKRLLTIYFLFFLSNPTGNCYIDNLYYLAYDYINRKQPVVCIVTITIQDTHFLPHTRSNNDKLVGLRCWRELHGTKKSYAIIAAILIHGILEYKQQQKKEKKKTRLTRTAETRQSKNSPRAIYSDDVTIIFFHQHTRYFSNERL